MSHSPTATTGTRTPGDRCTARRGVAWLAAIAAGGLGLSVLYRSSGHGLPCPFFLATGWWCPLCGGTRMGAALLEGNLAAAWSFNPVALIGLAVATIVGLGWLMELAGGPAVRPPRWLRTTPWARWANRHWWAAAAVVAVGFTVVRNLARLLTG